jgi:hypothetical protein
VEGKALGYLFGLLSDSDVESIRNNINILAKNQRQLTHVVNESLSVIRLSHEQIIENRKSINSVIESLYEFDNLTRAVAQEVKNTHTSLQLYIKFDRVLSEAHELVGKVREYLQNLKLQLNMLALCHLSSSVISQGEFRNELTGIESALTRQFRLPADPSQNLWAFYKTLACTTVLHDDTISVPLLDVQAEFELYKIDNLAVFLTNETAEENVNMMAQYQLETNELAINKNRTHFILLSSEEAHRCN